MRISDWSSDVCSSVLAAAAQDLDRAIDLGPAPDQRIDLAVLGLLVEVDRELLERAFALGLVGLGGFLVVGALGGRRFGGRAALADAVADEADRVEPARSEEHTSELQSLMRI